MLRALSKQEECWRALGLGIEGLGLPLPLTDASALGKSLPALGLSPPPSDMDCALRLLYICEPQEAPVSVSQTWTGLREDKQAQHP